ncbi:MAG TPA: molecular chaperone DnaK, partial [Kofleriaceae bacterium]|nr:molecular chaperone DnaK [Kofleriaceae bacterium]
NQLDTLLYGTKKLVSENASKLADTDKLMIEEALKEAEEVLERNRDGGNADELRGAFEKLQASAHKLAEAMYKQAGGGDAGAGGGEPQGEQPKNDDVIDAEFEDKS